MIITKANVNMHPATAEQIVRNKVVEKISKKEKKKSYKLNQYFSMD